MSTVGFVVLTVVCVALPILFAVLLWAAFSAAPGQPRRQQTAFEKVIYNLWAIGLLVTILSGLKRMSGLPGTERPSMWTFLGLGLEFLALCLWVINWIAKRAIRRRVE